MTQAEINERIANALPRPHAGAIYGAQDAERILDASDESIARRYYERIPYPFRSDSFYEGWAYCRQAQRDEVEMQRRREHLDRHEIEPAEAT